MQVDQLTPPGPDEIEISLFGPGVGEALAIHLGQGRWMLVDSCCKKRQAPAHLAYLESLGVDVKKVVELIVITHWHTDHIKGLSSVVSACTNAKVVLSEALQEDKFLGLAALNIPSGVKRTSGLEEFTEVLKTIINGGKEPILAKENTVLYSTEFLQSGEEHKVKVSALSPSNKAVYETIRYFSQLLQFGTVPTIPISRDPNHSSVVLWVEIGMRKILLGADLEATNDPKVGWTAILDSSNVISGTASVFKVPHHGSKNAHHNQVWENLLSETPYAILTPYTSGIRPLPFQNDIDRITSLTQKSYITALSERHRKHFSNRTVRTFVHEATRQQVAKSSNHGHIRLRCKLDEPGTDWGVELFSGACSLY